MSHLASRSARKYASVEAAALGGFKKVLTQSPDFRTIEHSFLVVSEVKTVLETKVVRYGHEAFLEDDQVMYYRYTEAEPNPAEDGRERTSWEIPPIYQPLVMALCHTHPDGNTFSSDDFNAFKRMQELTNQKKIKNAVVFYLMRGDGQIQWSDANDLENFVKGNFVDGIDKALP